jgi:4'-phosphopantetheinyl transferase
MLSHVSQQLSGYFTSGMVDWTQLVPGHSGHMVYIPVTSDPDVSSLCELMLSVDELQRSERFSTGADRTHFNQRRAFRRFCGAAAIGSTSSLEDIDFSETKNGRPFLTGYPDISFGFSSCQDGFLGAWSATHGIGVDIESKARQMDFIALARQFFSESEVALVENTQGLKRGRTFYHLWTLKEAALKCIGEGLPFGLDTFEFELAPALCIVKAPSEHGGPDQFFANTSENGDRFAAVVTRHKMGTARD